MLNKLLIRTIIYFAFAGLFMITHLHAASEYPSINKDTLIVGVAGSPPFVFNENAGKKGIAIEIWEELAQKKGWKFQFKYFESVDAVLDALNEGDLDVVAGPISITSHRLEYMKFS